MFRTTHWLAALALLALPILANGTQSQLREAGGEEIAPKASYKAGTLVTSKNLGVSFKVPDGCTASLDEKTWYVALRFEKEGLVGAVGAMTGVSQADAENFLAQPANFNFLGVDIVVEPVAEPATEGKRTVVELTGQDAVGGGIVLRGADNNALAVVVAGTASNVEAIKAALTSIEKSVSLTRPSVDARKKWHDTLAGRTLTVEDEQSAVTIVLDFAKDGRYRLKLSSGGESQEQDGQWRMELGVAGGLLILTAQGTTNYLKLTQSANEFTLEGYKAKLSGAQAGLKKPGDPMPGIGRTNPSFKSDIKEVESLEGKDIEFDVRYDGGTRLKIALLGVSLKVPENCIGGVTPSVNYVLIRPNDQRGLGTIAIQTGVSGMEEIVAALSGAKDLSDLEQGLVMEPDGEPKVEGSKASARHTSAQYVCYSVGMLGPSGNAVAISFIGPKDDDAKIKGYCEALAGSLQFAKPADSDQRKLWNEALKGYCLHHFNYKAAKDNSWDRTTNIYIHFGSDNTFYYLYQSEGTSVVKEETADSPYKDRWASGNHAEQTGTWKLEFTVTGALIYLKNDKGEVVPLLVQVNKYIYVNGMEVTRKKSDKKQ